MENGSNEESKRKAVIKFSKNKPETWKKIANNNLGGKIYWSKSTETRKRGAGKYPAS